MSIESAKEFAAKAHGNQLYGDKPYLYHLEKVASHLQGYGEEAQIIAYLHDVVEDTDVTVEQVKAKFGERVAACVSLLTDESGANRKERKAKTYKKMKAVAASSIESLGLVVKVADRLANFEECVLTANEEMMTVYLQELPHFRDAVYREGLCDDLWLKIDAIVSN